MCKVYLAIPYQHKDQKVMDHRVQMADKKAAELMDQGYIVFSPITHSHRIAKHIKTSGHLNHDFWLHQDKHFLDWCDKLVVCTVSGWEESYGVNWEIRYIKQQGKPIEYLNCGGE